MLTQQRVQDIAARLHRSKMKCNCGKAERPAKPWHDAKCPLAFRAASGQWLGADQGMTEADLAWYYANGGRKGWGWVLKNRVGIQFEAHPNV